MIKEKGLIEELEKKFSGKQVMILGEVSRLSVCAAAHFRVVPARSRARFEKPIVCRWAMPMWWLVAGNPGVALIADLWHRFPQRRIIRKESRNTRQLKQKRPFRSVLPLRLSAGGRGHTWGCSHSCKESTVF